MNINLIKNIAGGVIGIGVGFIVDGFIDVCCPDCKGVKKVFVSAAAGALSGYAGMVLGDYVGDQIEDGMTQIHNGIEEAKAYIDKAKAESEEEDHG